MYISNLILEKSVYIRGAVQSVRSLLIVNITNELKLIGALPRPSVLLSMDRAHSPTRAPWLLHPPSFPLVSSLPPLFSGTLAFWPADGY